LCPGKWGAGGVAAIGGGLVIIGGKRGVGGLRGGGRVIMGGKRGVGGGGL